jgi:phage gpG-like protein
MIRVEMRGDAEIIARLNAFPTSLRAILRRRVWALTLKLQARVQGKLSGKVLNVVTGALRRSIQSDVKETSGAVRGRVFSTGDVKYAAIHEFGGRTKAHIILPKKALALRFAMGGAPTGPLGPHMVFAKAVNHPGSRMPERSFMRSSLADMREEIVRELTQGVVEAAMQGASQ